MIISLLPSGACLHPSWHSHLHPLGLPLLSLRGSWAALPACLEHKEGLGELKFLLASEELLCSYHLAVFCPSVGFCLSWMGCRRTGERKDILSLEDWPNLRTQTSFCNSLRRLGTPSSLRGSPQGSSRQDPASPHDPAWALRGSSIKRILKPFNASQGICPLPKHQLEGQTSSTDFITSILCG